MKLYNKVDNNLLAKSRNIGLNAGSLLLDYQEAFRTMSFLLRKLFAVNTFDIELINEEKIYQLVIRATFEVSSNKEKFRVLLDDKEIKIFSKDANYVFELDDCVSNVVKLKEMAYYYNDRIIVERFNKRNISLEVHFKNSGKVCFFNVPIDMEETLDLSICEKIGEDDSIKDLKTFYLNNFYPLQRDYDRNELVTYVGVWYKEKDKEDYSNKGVKVDELAIERGQIINYQLGNVYMTNSGEKALITLTDGTCTITITDLENKQYISADFDKPLTDLLERKRTLI